MLVPVARMGRRHLPMHNWLGQPERQGQMWRKVLARTHRHTHIIYYYYRCAGLEQRLAGNARGEQRDGDVGDDEPREEERPHGEPAAQVAAQPVHAGGGAALRVPLPLARGEVVGEHLGASVRARNEHGMSRPAEWRATQLQIVPGSRGGPLTSMGALEARCTMPPSTGSGTSACGSAFKAAMPLAIPSSCALEMTARRAAGMARSPARPGIVNMKTAVTQVTPSFCTVHGAWVPVRGAAV